MHILIETLKENELSKILEIENKTFSNPWVESQFKEYFGKENKIIYVAKDLSSIVGYIIFEYVLDEGHISNLEVKEEFRNKGMGNRLVSFVINQAKKLSIRKILLEVRVVEDIAGLLFIASILGARHLGVSAVRVPHPHPGAVRLNECVVEIEDGEDGGHGACLITRCPLFP